MDLGKKIRQLRLKAGMTQEQLADKLGLVPQSVSKWENAAALPDITTLPLLAEIFGASIDDLFDLTAEQRLNRIENRLDIEADLPQEVFTEYEEFLKEQLSRGRDKKRPTELLAYLYWHRMDSFGRRACRYAKDAVQLSPNEHGYHWILQKAAGAAAWDWNMSNHTDAVNFYRELAAENPDAVQPYYYLLDNLIADHRADEAEDVLNRISALKDSRPVINEVYRAHIALARFDAVTADRIIEDLLAKHPEDDACLFEAAQYYAKKADYDKAIALYEKEFAIDPRRPRFQDALMGIADICQIMGDYKKAAETYGRIVDLLENEWGMTDDVELQNAKQRRDALLARA